MRAPQFGVTEQATTDMNGVAALIQRNGQSLMCRHNGYSRALAVNSHHFGQNRLYHLLGCAPAGFHNGMCDLTVKRVADGM